MTPSNSHKHAIPCADNIVRRTLSNGLTVLVKKTNSSPAVVMDTVIPGGAMLEPEEKAGLSSFHSSMLMKGTASHSFDELYEIIESNGASLSFGSGGFNYNFGSKSLVEDLPMMLNLASEILQEPTFPDEHIERLRRQIITGLQLRSQSTRSMAALKFNEIVYPEGHPFRISINGYPETITGITRDDILDFHSNLGPEGAVIVIVGAIDTDKAIGYVEKAFGGWRNPAQCQRPKPVPAPQLTASQSVFTEIRGKSQSDIVLGFPGPSRFSEDYRAAHLANNILGVFGMYGRLGEAVRKTQGLAYYSYSSLAGGFGPGPWKTAAGVAPQNVDKAVETIRNEIRRIVSEPVSEEELADNKASFKGRLVLGLETNEGVAGSIMNMEIFALGLDYLLNYNRELDKISVEQVRAAAQKYLDPDNYALSIAGPAV